MKAETANDSVEQIESKGNVLPSNIEAEKAILGAFLNNNEYINKVADFLLPEHFFVPLHRIIYQGILRFIERGMIANPITMKSLIEKDETFVKSGINCIEYLSKLSINSATIVNLAPYAKEIHDSALRRDLISLSEESITDAHTPNAERTAFHMIESAEQKLFNLASLGISDAKIQPLRVSLTESINKIAIARKRGGKFSGITTGYFDLDQILGGMQDSDLLILAARPSMGKTSLAINIALNAAVSFKNDTEEKIPKSVGVFSLEMSSEQLANRLLSMKTGINSSSIRTGAISKDEFAILSKESANLNDIPIYIDDTPALSISAVRTRARRMKRQFNLGLLVVDYLQLLRGVSKNDGNRVQEIGEISQGLKAIAKELNIPVIALSQLSRAVELREDKRPQLSDLRDSGNIEQDADIVMFIYREEYYLLRKKPTDGSDEIVKWQQDMERAADIADIIIAKQRNGPTGNVSLRFDSRTTKFTNLDKEHSTYGSEA